MTIITFTYIISAILGVLIARCIHKKEYSNIDLFLICIIFVSTLFIAGIYTSEPKAIDVYNNKTTLEYEYTIIDGVKQDSTAKVIFKTEKVNNYKN